MLFRSIDVDSDLLVEKTTQKVGSQAVTLMLRGNGALLLDGHPPTELTFLCLLADDKRAVFFDWLQRRDAPVLAQCRRGASQPAQPAQLEACFARLRQLADYDLLAAGTSRFQAAIEADSASGGARAEAFRAADAAWRAYRDTECRGRREGAGADAANAEKACLIQLDIRRARELRMAR